MNLYAEYNALIAAFNAVFFWGMALVVLLTCLYVWSPADERLRRDRETNIPSLGLGLLIVAALVTFFAYYPIQWGTYADREAYYYVFTNINVPTTDVGDPSWEWINRTIHTFTDDVVVFFALLALLYVGLRFAACRMLSRSYGFLLMMMVVSSFLFESYGDNTIRSGVASSMVLLAISIYPHGNVQKVAAVLLALAAIGVHKSMALPVAAFAVAQVAARPRVWLTMWVLSFFVSLAVGNAVGTALGGFIENNAGEQAGAYILDAEEALYRTGFRFDFVLYSLVPIVVGWYYIAKKGFDDRFYNQLYCTYIMANILFVLVIRAAFVDRFGYLSWFLMPIVLMYPLLKKRMFQDQNKVIGWMLLLNAAFTLLMYLRG